MTLSMLSSIFFNVSRSVRVITRKNFSTNMAKKTAILLIADGSEEMEAVITADILRRAGVRYQKNLIDNLVCVRVCMILPGI